MHNARDDLGGCRCATAHILRTLSALANKIGSLKIQKCVRFLPSSSRILFYRIIEISVSGGKDTSGVTPSPISVLRDRLSERYLIRWVVIVFGREADVHMHMVQPSIPTIGMIGLYARNTHTSNV